MKLNDEIKFVLLLIAVLVSIIMAFIQPNYKEVTVRYDCRIAEISPDIPAKVREECRKLQEKK
jgi:hypothetical protein